MPAEVVAAGVRRASAIPVWIAVAIRVERPERIVIRGIPIRVRVVIAWVVRVIPHRVVPVGVVAVIVGIVPPRAADADSDEHARATAAPVAEARGVVRIPVRIRVDGLVVSGGRVDPFVDVVINEVIVEVRASDLPHELGQVRLDVARERHLVERPKIPMVADDDTVPAIRVPRNRGVHRAAARADVHLERLLFATAEDLILPAPADEVVVIGIQGKQHPKPIVRIEVKDEEVPIVAGPDLNLDLVTPLEPAVFVEPDPNGRVIGLRDDRARDRLGRNAQCQ